MTIKDRLLALYVVVVWGINFVVMKIGLHDMPPFLLAGLRFLLVALPAVLLVMLGLLVNVFGARLWPLHLARQP